MSLPPQAVRTCLAAYDAGERPDRGTERAAVRAALDALVARAPGRSVEVRVPPYAAVQAIPGSTHRRGTPPAVVEADAPSWLLLASGRLGWAAAVADGRVRASGERSDLSEWLPLWPPAPPAAAGPDPVVHGHPGPARQPGTPAVEPGAR